MRTPVAACGLVVLLAAIAACPGPARAATVSGQLGGSGLLSGTSGVASVRAVSAETAIVAGDARLKAGHFTLSLGPGPYLLLAATTPFHAAASIDRAVGTVDVRGAKRRSLRLSLRPRRVTRKRARSAGGPSFVPVDYPAVWVQHFRVNGPAAVAYIGKAMSDLLITDLVATVGPACDGAVVERERIADVIAEQKRSHSPGFDPSTAIPLGHMIAHNRLVTGTVTISGATITITATVTNTRTGLRRSLTRSGATNDLFALEQSMVKELTDKICEAPSLYVGPVSGSIPAAALGASGTFTWSGTVTLVLVRTGGAPKGLPPGDYGYYRPEAGTVHLTFESFDGECTGHGETDISVSPTAAQEIFVEAGVTDPRYSLYAEFGASPGIPYTVSGPDPCPNSGTLPFGAGFPALATGAPQRAATRVLSGRSDASLLGLGSVRREWSLSPQEGKG